MKQTDIDITLSYRPMPKQNAFHGQATKYRLFTGGFGNGKTSAGCVEALALSLEYPGTLGLICRKTRPELLSTTMDVFWNGGGGDPESGDWQGIPQELVRSHNQTKSLITLVNGSRILYWPLDDPKKLTNVNLGWYLVDQAEEVSEEMFLMLNGRLRRRRSPRKGMLLSNPNGHDWLWKRFMDLKLPDHGYVHAKTSDNPNLTSDYIAQFDQYPDAWRKRFFEGSFDVFTGQIWPDFDRDVHLIRPVPPEPWWEWVECIDHGRRNPTAVLWLAFFEKFGFEYCFVCDEHLVAGQRVSYHAQKILANRELLAITPNYTVIDASAAQKDPNTERSVMDEYWDWGIITVPSDRHVIARVNRVAEWLALNPRRPHPLTGETRSDGWPGLYIFKSCPEIAEHVQQYRWKPQPPNRETDAKEEPLEKDDHDVDALGYGLMTRPKPGREPLPRSELDARSWRYWEKVRGKMSGAGQGHAMLGSEG